MEIQMSERIALRLISILVAMTTLLLFDALQAFVQGDFAQVGLDAAIARYGLMLFKNCCQRVQEAAVEHIAEEHIAADWHFRHWLDEEGSGA
jgi:hypothetical protein